MELKNIRMFGLVMFACLLSCLPKLQFSSNPRSKPGGESGSAWWEILDISLRKCLICRGRMVLVDLRL